MELVAEMRSRAIPLNVHTYSALLNVCLKANELDLSLDVYARMLAEGVTPNLVTFNTLLDIFNKTGRWMDALKVLELLHHQVCCCTSALASGRYIKEPPVAATSNPTHPCIASGRRPQHLPAGCQRVRARLTCRTSRVVGKYRGNPLCFVTDRVMLMTCLQNLRPEARTYNAIIATCNGAGRYAEVGLQQQQPGVAQPDSQRLCVGAQPSSRRILLAAKSRAGLLSCDAYAYGQDWPISGKLQLL